MKTLKLMIPALFLCLSALLPARGQSTNSSSLWNSFEPLTKATNWVVAPYATYAPDAPVEWGGGVLAVYNINNYVGAGLGVDWLGEFNLVSGNLTLKLPVKPLAFIGSQWAKDFVVTPFGLAGLATPLGGAGRANGQLATVEGAGIAFDVAKLWGGKVGTGFEYSLWQNAGPYSVKHFHIFLTWTKNF